MAPYRDASDHFKKAKTLAKDPAIAELAEGLTKLAEAVETIQKNVRAIKPKP